MSLPASLKGHKFNPRDLDTMPRYSHSWSDERRAAFAGAETERYRIVSTCDDCGYECIADEEFAHACTHVSHTIRPLVRLIDVLNPADRDELMNFCRERYG